MNTLRKAAVLLAGLAVWLLAAPPAALAHPLSTTAVLVDVGAHQVTATVELPLDELSIAMDDDLTATNVLDASTLTDLRAYVQDHMSATDDTGQTWATIITGGHVAQVDGTDNLVLEARLTPSTGSVGDFVLNYDAIIDTVVAHRVFVSARYGDQGAYTTLTMLSWQTTSVPVAAVTTSGAAPATSQGFLAAVHLGFEHISAGSDHLLFLITLLLPAPLVAGRRRWRQGGSPGRAAVRVLHVVTAFAVGHSITLALGALGWVHLPTRLVEAGIALSVLVSAIHAIRPLVRRGETIIALTFGLLHGLAFATLLTDLDLGRGSLVTTLLGFNLGIELTQLLVVALVMPSLLVLSRSRIYPAVRVTLAGTAGLLAAGWLTQRVGLIDTNPLEPLGNLLVDHPLLLATGLVVFAAASKIGAVPALSSHRRTQVAVQHPS